MPITMQQLTQGIPGLQMPRLPAPPTGLPQTAQTVPQLQVSGGAPTPPSAPTTIPQVNPSAIYAQLMQKSVNPTSTPLPAPQQPPDLEGLVKRYGLWKGLAEKIQTDPAFFQGLLTFGAVMMSPHAAGTPAFANLGPAVLDAQKAYNSARAGVEQGLLKRQMGGIQEQHITQGNTGQAAGLLALPGNQQVALLKAKASLLAAAKGGKPTFIKSVEEITGKDGVQRKMNVIRSISPDGTTAVVSEKPVGLTAMPSRDLRLVNAITGLDRATNIMTAILKHDPLATGPLQGIVAKGRQAFGMMTTEERTLTAVFLHETLNYTGLIAGRTSLPILKKYLASNSKYGRSVAFNLILIRYTRMLLGASAHSIVQQYAGTGTKIPPSIAAFAKTYNPKEKPLQALFKIAPDLKAFMLKNGWSPTDEVPKTTKGALPSITPQYIKNLSSTGISKLQTLLSAHPNAHLTPAAQQALNARTGP